jgi:hypothetical protein
MGVPSPSALGPHHPGRRTPRARYLTREPAPTLRLCAQADLCKRRRSLWPPRTKHELMRTGICRGPWSRSMCLLKECAGLGFQFLPVRAGLDVICTLPCHDHALKGGDLDHIRLSGVAKFERLHLLAFPIAQSLLAHVVGRRKPFNSPGQISMQTGPWPFPSFPKMSRKMTNLGPELGQWPAP